MHGEGPFAHRARFEGGERGGGSKALCHRVAAASIWLMAAATWGGCDSASATSIGSNAPAFREGSSAAYAVRIAVAALSAGQRAQLEQHLRDRGYSDVTITAEGATTIVLFQTDRPMADVERDLLRLQQPRLEYVRRGYVLEFQVATQEGPGS